MQTSPSKSAGVIRTVFNRLAGWLKLGGALCTTLVLRNNVKLWRKVAFAGPPPWDERNRIIAGFIPAGSSVLDVGCGAQSLKQYLPAGCKYQPSDIIKSSPEVIFCDVNGGVYPDTKEYFDFVVCSGVLEYVRRPQEFLEKIPKYGRSVIMSYNPLYPGDSKLKRQGNGWGWINHFKKEELEGIFEELGLSWKLVHTDKLAYVIYLLEKRK